ncbi:MAG TPA: hypothetical protein VHS28_07160, partial [Chloroflexota bacterium]|nr:hypothetical protein [Chloroflexota bacterium]
MSDIDLSPLPLGEGQGEGHCAESSPVTVRGARSSLIPPYSVIACSIVFFWSISVRSLISAVLPSMAADITLSSSAAGILLSVMLLGYTAASWSAGWMPGSRKLRILVGVLISIPSAVSFSLAPTYELLL